MAAIVVIFASGIDLYRTRWVRVLFGAVLLPSFLSFFFYERNV